MNLSLSPQGYSAAGLGIGVTPASPVWMDPHAEISHLPVREFRALEHHGLRTASQDPEGSPPPRTVCVAHPVTHRSAGASPAESRRR